MVYSRSWNHWSLLNLFLPTKHLSMQEYSQCMYTLFFACVFILDSCLVICPGQSSWDPQGLFYLKCKLYSDLPDSLLLNTLIVCPSGLSGFMWEGRMNQEEHLTLFCFFPFKLIPSSLLNPTAVSLWHCLR